MEAEGVREEVKGRKEGRKEGKKKGRKEGRERNGIHDVVRKVLWMRVQKEKKEGRKR